MSAQTSGFPYQQLPEPLYQRLLDYQQRRGHDTLSAAVIELLTQGLLAETLSTEAITEDVVTEDVNVTAALPTSEPVTSESDTDSSPPVLDEKINVIEQRLASLTQELRQLRRESPGQHDRLREQLAAVRLSHSGLIQDLTRRLEALESATFAPFHLQPDAIGLGSPVRQGPLMMDHALATPTHPEMLVAHGPLPENLMGGKIMANEFIANDPTSNGSATSGQYTPESNVG